MSIPFVIKERVLNVGPEKGSTKFYAVTENMGEIGIEELTVEISKMSTVSGADIRAVLYSLTDILPSHLAANQIVRLGELGSLRLSNSSRGENSSEEVDAHSITHSKLIFSPGKALKQMLQNLSFSKKS